MKSITKFILLLSIVFLNCQPGKVFNKDFSLADLLERIKKSHEEAISKNEMFTFDFEKPIFNNFLPGGLKEVKNDLEDLNTKIGTIEEEKPEIRDQKKNKYGLYQILKDSLQKKFMDVSLKESMKVMENMISDIVEKEADKIHELKEVLEDSQAFKDIYNSVVNVVEQLNGKGNLR